MGKHLLRTPLWTAPMGRMCRWSHNCPLSHCISLPCSLSKVFVHFSCLSVFLGSQKLVSWGNKLQANSWPLPSGVPVPSVKDWHREAHRGLCSLSSQSPPGSSPMFHQDLTSPSAGLRPAKPAWPRKNFPSRWRLVQHPSPVQVSPLKPLLPTPRCFYILPIPSPGLSSGYLCLSSASQRHQCPHSCCLSSSSGNH